MRRKTTPPAKRKNSSAIKIALAEILKTRIAETKKLLRRIKRKLNSLEELLRRTRLRGVDPIYRFYHQSFKVFFIQDYTEEVVAALQDLAPHLPLNDWFTEIIRQGTGREFTMDDNANWTAVTRPMLEAYFHARFFLETACEHGRELEAPPEILPSGWAALLYLYNIR